jgi:hypothetical protein
LATGVLVEDTVLFMTSESSERFKKKESAIEDRVVRKKGTSGVQALGSSCGEGGLKSSLRV